MSFLVASAVHKSYRVGDRRLHVLRDLGLSVERGEMVAVVGASGVGKSTLLHLLGGLDATNGGSVRVGAVDLATLSADALVAFRNAHVGFVFQFHHLLPEFSALENAEMPLRIARRPASEASARAERMLRRVGLGDRLTHRPGMLSGGEQQRVAVARALVNEPLVLLADEPSGNLDGATSERLHELLFRLREERALSMVIVTHNPDLARRADRRLLMADGRLHDQARG